MKLTFLLTISSVLTIPSYVAANEWAKRLMEKLKLNPKDHSKIQQAILVERLEPLKAMIEHASDSELKAANKEGMNAAHMAAAFGRKDVLELLHGKNKKLILKENNAGHEAIHVAAICGEAEIVKFLVNVADVEVDVKSGKKKMTSLQLAAESGCVDAIATLVELKADIDACDRNKGILTPLAYAVAGGHIEATKTLLELGADKEKQVIFDDSVTCDIMKPVIIAVYKLKVEIARLLLTQNADTIYGHLTIVHYLSHAPPAGDAGKKMEEMLDMLIDKRVVYDGVITDIPMRCYLTGKRNIISYTLSKKNYEMFRVLIRKINEETRPGNAKGIWTELFLDAEKQRNNVLISRTAEKWEKEITFALVRTEAIRVGAANFYMEAWKAEIIVSWFGVDGWPVSGWKRENFKELCHFYTFCKTLLKKCEETWVDIPKGIATDLSSLFPLYKSRNFYIFYLALQSYYSEYMLLASVYGDGNQNRILAKRLLEEYSYHKERKEEYLLRNEEDRIQLLSSSNEDEYIIKDRIRFLNLLKEIYVWRPEIEEDAFILAHLKKKFEFNSDEVKALFSEDPKK